MKHRQFITLPRWRGSPTAACSLFSWIWATRRFWYRLYIHR